VSISAGATYVVSYYAPVGRYATDAGFFAASGVDNAPLHALTDGQDGPNGCVPVRDGRRFPDSVLAVEQLLGRSDLHRGGLRS